MPPTYRNHHCRLAAYTFQRQRVLFLENELLRGPWVMGVLYFVFRLHRVRLRLPRAARWSLPELEGHPQARHRGRVQPVAAPIVAPLTGRPCLAYEIRVCEADQPRDPDWLLHEQHAVDLRVGEHEVRGDELRVWLPREQVEVDDGKLVAFPDDTARRETSRLDLVVCRNLLIYLTQETQAPVLVIETEKKALHQFEWTSFSIYQFKDNPQDSTTFAIGTYGGADVSWRYQYSVPLTINSEKVIPYLGLSGQVGADYDYKAPAVSDEFSTYAFQLYTRFGLVPALRFQSGKRLFFDVELPLDFIVMDR